MVRRLVSLTEDTFSPQHPHRNSHPPMLLFSLLSSKHTDSTHKYLKTQQSYTDNKNKPIFLKELRQV